MTERTWKWFKQGYQFDIKCKAIKVNNEYAYPAITVFTEYKDKQEARRLAIKELSKYGYTAIEVCKVIER